MNEEPDLAVVCPVCVPKDCVMGAFDPFLLICIVAALVYGAMLGMILFAKYAGRA